MTALSNAMDWSFWCVVVIFFGNSVRCLNLMDDVVEYFGGHLARSFWYSVRSATQKRESSDDTVVAGRGVVVECRQICSAHRCDLIREFFNHEYVLALSIGSSPLAGVKHAVIADPVYHISSED